MSDCIAGSRKRSAQPTKHCPEDDDRGQALGERHRKGTDGVAEQTQNVGALAAEEIADLAAYQDERGGHKRLERDRGLDTADGCADVLNHRSDRNVHQRCIDDEHEHRHRQQEGQAWIGRSLIGNAGTRCLGHVRLKFRAPSSVKA